MATIAEIAERAKQEQRQGQGLYPSPRSISEIAAEARYPELLAAAQKVLENMERPAP